ncbi:PhzF family phenazine biosynthesis protein [Salegentibacter sediminis]|uniref:PhzF family phenazine biosynthesis protein n=1 Tax=Salegentibacter sediminis TaxID=1930251 RepID=UPI0009BCD1E6|nr:PhzF family phenazine biosynthesis isomerase [Salegentibacter sediminis]
MNIKTYIIDAFTTELFKGNQAAVCLLENELDETTMLNIAREFGFSETAFVIKQNTASFSIRYFSPVKEIPLCGHATLASSKAIFTEFKELSRIIFQTHFGDTLEISQTNGKIEMKFPLHQIEPTEYNNEIRKALGLNEIYNSGYNTFHNMLLLEIESSRELENLQPNFSVLRNTKTSLSGVLVTAKSVREDFDYEYRYFFPWSGADEDPVTGGVQSFLAKYWSDKLKKTKMKAFQCSKRTGSMDVELLENSVLIRSNAVIFTSGILNLT